MEGPLEGRVCLVTGATLGIGKITALELAKMGATVSIVARNAERGKAVADEVAKAGGREVKLFLADLSLMADVRRLADEIKGSHPKLHVLVNNAGAIHTTRKVTAEGLETTFATNHLAYFLLTNSLLPLLESSGPARIVSVSSEAHRRGRFDIDDLMSERDYSGWRAYCNSKLCNILFTYELARRLEGKPITANCLHPGFISSGFGKNDGGFFAFLVTLARPIQITAEKGALTQIYLASSPEVEGVSGKYFDKCKQRRSITLSYDEALQKRLWDRSVALTQMNAVAA